MAAMLALMLVAAVPVFAASGDIDRVDSDQIQASLTI